MRSFEKCKETSAGTAGIIDRNTFIGFDDKEVRSLSIKELIALKNAISAYLNTTNLKIRNSNYKVAFKRITKELLRRKQVKAGILIEDDIKPEEKSDTKSIIVTVEEGNNSAEQTIKLLGKKMSPEKTLLDIEIPNFFNDSKVVKKEESKIH
jgi:hypothetical protein